MVRTSSFLPLKANDEVRAATCKPDTLDSAVIRSSVMPSLKYSFSLSELMLTKGSTATDFRSWVAGGVPACRDRHTMAPAPTRRTTPSAATPGRRHVLAPALRREPAGAPCIHGRTTR